MAKKSPAKAAKKTVAKSSSKTAAKTSKKEVKKGPFGRPIDPNAKSKAKAKPAARKPLPTWKAPEDFKPHFVEVLVKTEKDGLLGSGIRCTRFQGRYDPKAEDKKKADMASYDMKTVIGIQSRLAAVTYATNALRRLPANTTFLLVLRVNRKSADGSLSVLSKGISEVVKSKKTGRLAPKALDKTDPNYRKFRKAMRILPVAFKDVLMPPKRERGANKKDQDDE